MRKEEIERRKNKKKINQNNKERGNEYEERRYVLKEDEWKKKTKIERDKRRESLPDPEKGTRKRESEKTARFRKKLPPP